MINILTLKVGKKYDERYVNELYRAIKRNTTVDFNFYCYTEDGSKLLPEIKVVHLNDPKAYYKQWHKMEFHRMGFGDIAAGEKCLILDIDWIVTGNLDKIFKYEFSEDIAVFERWWSHRKDQCKLNGGFQMFYMGNTDYVWRKFYDKPEHYQDYYYENGLCAYPKFGEQNFIDETVQSKSWLPKEWFGKYTDSYLPFIQMQWTKEVGNYDPFFIAGDFAESVKMVHFADDDNMIHEHKEKWIHKYWNKGE